MNAPDRPPPSGNAPPLSPCIKVCVLDRVRGLCTGCARTIDEIARWWGMSDEQKRAVLAQLPQRRPG
jgi:uncharacterized protein